MDSPQFGANLSPMGRLASPDAKEHVAVKPGPPRPGFPSEASSGRAYRTRGALHLAGHIARASLTDGPAVGEFDEAELSPMGPVAQRMEGDRYLIADFHGVLLPPVADKLRNGAHLERPCD